MENSDCCKNSKRGEIATLLIIASLVVIGVSTIASTFLSKGRQTTSSRASGESTACTLNAAGSPCYQKSDGDVCAQDGKEGNCKKYSGLCYCENLHEPTQCGINNTGTCNGFTDCANCPNGAINCVGSICKNNDVAQCGIGGTERCSITSQCLNCPNGATSCIGEKCVNPDIPSVTPGSSISCTNPGYCSETGGCPNGYQCTVYYTCFQTTACGQVASPTPGSANTCEQTAGQSCLGSAGSCSSAGGGAGSGTCDGSGGYPYCCKWGTGGGSTCEQTSGQSCVSSSSVCSSNNGSQGSGTCNGGAGYPYCCKWGSQTPSATPTPGGSCSYDCVKNGTSGCPAGKKACNQTTRCCVAPSSTPGQTVSNTPTPTTPTRGTCKAENSACNINDPDACGAGCQELGCAYVGTETKCVRDTGVGPCEVDKCNAAKQCQTVHVGIKGGCTPTADNDCCPANQCSWDPTEKDCNQPPPNPGNTTISAPSVVEFVEDGIKDRNRAKAAITLSKNEFGAKIVCSQPTITPENTGAKCYEDPYGRFTPCDDPQSCSGTILAKNAGTCNIYFHCINIQNSADVSSSKTITIKAVKPTSTPPSAKKPSPTKKVNPECMKKELGDANCDEAINSEDYIIWGQDYIGEGQGSDNSESSSEKSTRKADFNKDKEVNLIDFEIWRRHIGE